MKPRFFYKLDYEHFVCMAIGKTDVRMDTFRPSWTWGYHYSSDSIDELYNQIQNKHHLLISPIYK